MGEIKLLNGGVAVDDRGYLLFCNDFDFARVKRFYQVSNHRQGFIRAWHGHEREGKFVWAAAGSALIGIVPLDATPEDCSAVKKFVLSDKNPKILFIPPGHYNGFKSLEPDTRLQFFSTTSLDESLGDDIRQPYDTWNIWDEDFR